MPLSSPRPASAVSASEDDGATWDPHDDAVGIQVEALLDRAVERLGGVRRDGQVAMARAVAEAIDVGEHLLVQAGTGTGKSLGYLVPAVRHAVREDERVVVSTATLALQRQVVTRDLPLVADAIAPELPRAPRIALLKGWHNYVCRQKVVGGYPADDTAALFTLPAEPPVDAHGEHAGAADHPAPEGGADRLGDLGSQVVRLRAWAESTETGDRDDLVPGVSDRAWRQVSVTSLECLGPRCAMLEECFPHAARNRAKEADVVVTNHAMLGIAASGAQGVLPEHDVLVVDEAHELTDRVTAQATVDLSVATVEQAARLARRHGGVPTDDLDAASAALGVALAALPEGRLRDGLPPAAAAAVAAVRDAARGLSSALRPEGGAPQGAAEGGVKMATSAVLALFEIADRMARGGDAPGSDVLWCSRSDDGGRRGGGMSRLHAAPLAVDGLIRSHLLAGRSVVLTSATLALGGTFVPLARAVGVERPASAPQPSGSRSAAPARAVAEDPTASSPPPIRERADDHRPWHAIDVGSPFDYRRQGILYIASRLPAPGREPTTEAQLDEIAALVTAAGGRTLGLFSSRRAATAAAEAMRERLDVPVLAQGDDVLPTLVRQFAQDPATCLFGTLSLWQGVDVAGPSCQLVLIDRIPFPRPDDPVHSARSEAVAAAGGNGFMAVAATHAALLLAQGAGRLIRTSADRGVVAVLDPRLATARYGEFLARSLPDFWRTTDRDRVVAALQRLAT